ncbi:PREDICTED: SKI family transcriptional corepressor 1 [Nipponia nippon]|uniref:SKI family transcriptional corepressor 1 n=1 Tax=Nipponia nippon TaxID=128390 RepID=UPI0005119679|nr:PREDICTED: SKI family transcriptional corepressor 1 [Nipponia nippon]
MQAPPQIQSKSCSRTRAPIPSSPTKWVRPLCTACPSCPAPPPPRRCGMITKREAERLCKSFLGEHKPPKLPENFAFDVVHECAWGSRGSFIPARYNSSRAKCIKCSYCSMYFSPNKFIFHSHRTPDSKYTQPDAANFNSWRRHLKLSDKTATEELSHAWEDVKAMFNGGTRKRTFSLAPGTGFVACLGTDILLHRVSCRRGLQYVTRSGSSGAGVAGGISCAGGQLSPFPCVFFCASLAGSPLAPRGLAAAQGDPAEKHGGARPGRLALAAGTRGSMPCCWHCRTSAGLLLLTPAPGQDPQPGSGARHVPSSRFPPARLPEPCSPRQLSGPRARLAAAALTCPAAPCVAAALTDASAKMSYYVVLIFSHYLALIKMYFAEFNMRLQMTQRIKCLIY